MRHVVAPVPRGVCYQARVDSVLFARLALALVGVLVALPSPLATYWGGRVVGAALPVLVIGLIWSFGVVAAHRLRRGGHMWIDVTALTGVLSVSGAAQNPFSMLYFVPITLASVVAPRSTWRIAALAVLGFAVLLAQTTRLLWPHRDHPHHAHFFHHVVGMAVALAVVGGFVSFFVHRIGNSLSEKRARLLRLERQQQEDRFAVSLGALSAGAGHELGTPLGTIQLLAEDLPRLCGDERDQASQQILLQVRRMKAILHGLTSSELSAEVLEGCEPWTLEDLRKQVAEEGLGLVGSGNFTSTQPLFIVAQIARELVRNARTSCPQGAIQLSLESDAHNLRLEVADGGPGLSEDDLRQAFSPFFSQSGGTGLGLFLGSVHARQLGGELRLESTRGRGTRAILELPRHPQRAGSRRRGQAGAG